MKRKGWIALLVGALAVGALGVMLFTFSSRSAESVTVSVGLQQLADDAQLVASAPTGERVRFDGAWFDKALQGGTVTAVTVTRLPDVTAGELLLGYSEVSVGQRITRENFSYLNFEGGASPMGASFSFVPETKEGMACYELVCALRFTEGVNCCPEGRGSVMAVATHTGLSLVGELEAEDPDGDALCFETVRYPENGTLQMEAATGRFVYTPHADFEGEDVFVWRVQDSNGAFGEDQSVSVTVRPLATGYLFSDMEGNAAHSAALRIAEQGLLSGEKMGGKHYFHPERTLTRAAFVTILLKAAEIEYPETESTGYTDDADIPHGMRGAIRYAREQGWLGEDTVFRPNEPITRAEAASIATRVLGLAAPGYGEAVRDHDTIPVSVVDALYAAFEGGYIETMTDGALAHNRALARAEAAVFFDRVLG